MQPQTPSNPDRPHDQVAIGLDTNIARNSVDGDDHRQELSGFRAIFVSVTVSGMVFISSLSTGLLATGLPNIASNLGIPDALILWPASIYGLTCGCSLIPVGSIADVIGSGPVYLFGCVFLSLSFLACGLARTGTELILFRGFQGVAASCCLPTAISILTEIFPQGRQQTRGMAILGAAQPLGYSAGLFLGGVLVDSIGWRWGWYIASILSMLVFGVVFRAVPRQKQMSSDTWRRLACGIDWIGALVASACLGILSYVLALSILDGAANETEKTSTHTKLCVA
ncbi:hypothetical protein E4T44_00035 [Aureobasidium sp. EXF-8845]|nr:hypothetical protein E4T44_00035 [Aureobasidium sp. EXF-8845]KAI4858437.1 hypothetical protein E4T45_00052 [Aureobasidium sp. EXF-8846]